MVLVMVMPNKLNNGSAFKLISCTTLLYYILRVFSKITEIRSRLRSRVKSLIGKIRSKNKSVRLAVAMDKSLSRGNIMNTIIRAVVKEINRTKSSLDSAKARRTDFLIF